MKINPLISICRRLPIPALAAVIALAAGGCDVTQPDENPWRDASAYSWPVTVNKVLHYRTTDLESGIQTDDTVKISISDTLHTDGSSRFFARRATGNSTRRLFLPLKDTLLTRNNEFPSDLALITPLEKGHTWICGSRTVGTDTGDVTVPWKAEIVERYSFRKIEGVIYKNVIEVEYKAEFPVASDEIVLWTRFYAEGKGVVQTLESVVSRQKNPDDPAPIPKLRGRTVLVEPEVASN